MVTTAFLTHARMAAKNLKLDTLPLVVAPHPLNDLTPAQVEELARAAYPVIIEHLIGANPPPEVSRLEFAHPASRGKAAKAKEGAR